MIEQAANNSREQFGASPDLMRVYNDALIASLDAHNKLGAQTLSDDRINRGLLHLLMNQMQLYEFLRARR